MKPVQLPLVPDLQPKRYQDPGLGRCRALIRTWDVLRSLDGSGRTLAELADTYGVAQRTIRRDLEVLQAAGFPLIDEQSDYDAAKRWRLLQWRRARREGAA
jgi:predicted ArsR family transcriptional regulator